MKAKAVGPKHFSKSHCVLFVIFLFLTLCHGKDYSKTCSIKKLIIKGLIHSINEPPPAKRNLTHFFQNFIFSAKLILLDVR